MITNGIYSEARPTPAHPGRVGPPIAFSSVVVHTTDTFLGGFDAIVRSWTSTSGNGACAHFMIGREPADGVVQFVSILRNGNHAGGFPRHGWYTVQTVAGAPNLVHPNTAAVGIELDAAGYLGKPVGGKWIHPDTKRQLDTNDVDVDSRGHGWHKITPYQYEQLDRLLTELTPLAAKRPGLRVTPNGTYEGNVVPWAAMEDPSIIGHVTLDPTQKTDPGPFVLDWIRKRGH